MSAWHTPTLSSHMLGPSLSQLRIFKPWPPLSSDTLTSSSHMLTLFCHTLWVSDQLHARTLVFDSLSLTSKPDFWHPAIVLLRYDLILCQITLYSDTLLAYLLACSEPHFNNTTFKHSDPIISHALTLTFASQNFWTLTAIVLWHFDFILSLADLLLSYMLSLWPITCSDPHFWHSKLDL